MIYKNFSIIVAMDSKGGIGKNNFLPWILPKDLALFKKITCTTKDKNKNNAIIMGRKTWESIPKGQKPLKNRMNIVLSRKNIKLPNGVFSSNYLEGAIWLASRFKEDIESIFVIGGGTIYSQAIKLNNCERLYINEIVGSFDCDVFFPEFRSDFKLESIIKTGTDNNFRFIFSSYIRK